MADVMSMHAGAPPVLAAVDPDPVVPDPVLPNQELYNTLYSPPRQGNSILQPRDVQSLDPADQSTGVIQFRQDRLRQAEVKPSGQGRALSQYSDASSAKLQLQLRRLELEHETRRMELEQEREREREQQQFELRKLELEVSRVAAFSAQPTAPHSPRAPPFRVEAAFKLVLTFAEHDLEIFLISFEKIAELNSFPTDKYAAILQAHLTGKALKVFTELSVEECRDYPL